MPMRGIALAVMLLAPLAAQAQLRAAPPAAPVEAAPDTVPAGFVWDAGHWVPDGQGYRWVKGTFVAARPAFVFRPALLEQSGGLWYFRDEQWIHRDRMGLGAPGR